MAVAVAAGVVVAVVVGMVLAGNVRSVLGTVIIRTLIVEDLCQYLGFALNYIGSCGPFVEVSQNKRVPY